MLCRLILPVFVLGLFHFTSQAQRSIDNSIHQHYLSTRALGMGNAFTAVVDDHSSIFYNPAALAKREDGHLRFSLRGGGSPEYLQLADDISNAQKIENESERLDRIAEIISSNYGRNYHARIPTVSAMWARPNWSLAFIPADLTTDVGIHQQLGPMLNVNAYLDSTLAYGYGKDVNWLGEGHDLSVGATVKGIHRIHVGEALSVGRLSENSDFFDRSSANEGFTLDFDVGTLYTPAIPESGFFAPLKYFKPTFAVVVRNLLDQGFGYNFNLIDANSGRPPNLQRRLDLGSKWQLPRFWVFDPHFAADLRDIGHTNWTLSKGTHIGAEFFWTMFNWWKGYWSAGLNQGLWTAGFGARLAWFQLEAATYGEDVGTAAVPKRSRRFMLELALDF